MGRVFLEARDREIRAVHLVIRDGETSSFAFGRARLTIALGSRAVPLVVLKARPSLHPVFGWRHSQ